MRFTKMQSLGNDYIFVDAINQKIKAAPELSVRLCDRHYGVGSDGLVLICPSEAADFRMRIFNPDGTEAEICGNALRSMAKYVYDFGLTRKREVNIETLAGVRTMYLTVRNGRAEMIRGDLRAPVLEAEKIPVLTGKEFFIGQSVEAAGREFKVTAVSMGNPHAVVFTDDVQSLDISIYGPALEKHRLFPKRTNVEFARVADRHNIRMRAWERGTGETLACATGSCASAVAGVLNGLCERSVTVHQIGGRIEVEWDDKSGSVFMTGPSAWVFDGEI